MYIPVSEMMSWASQRRTTREEDMAYSLMGLFDINMPLLYGEGSKAFKRLQEEIIRQSSTYTIFVWRTTDSSRVYHGPLAPSSSCFDPSELRFLFNSTGRPPSVSSRGVRMEVYLKKYGRHMHLYEAVLQRESKSARLSPSILVLHIPGGPEEPGKDRKVSPGDDFVRVHASQIHYVNLHDWSSDLRSSSKKEIVLNNVSTTPPLASKPELTQELYIHGPEPQGVLAEEGKAYTVHSRNYLTKPNFGKMIGLIYRIQSHWFVVAIGLATSGTPCCHVLHSTLPDHALQAEEAYERFSFDVDDPLLATYISQGIRAAVWLSHSARWPILCVSVECLEDGPSTVDRHRVKCLL